MAEPSQPGRRPGGRTPNDRQSPEVPVHLPTPAVAVTVVYAAALAVAVASAATGSTREALAGLVVLAALFTRWAVRRSRRTVPSTAAAVVTVDAVLPDTVLPEAAPAVRAA
ncbi:hypothetical protein [Geodermatophilus amargosae]|uniref:hypothetical protein n=1 Tax=Geodermatophilus amargosae TaxID=1296565 RepID=UPI00111495F3|nr:hypothetical protein [Geodermatophilus amargosae]